MEPVAWDRQLWAFVPFEQWEVVTTTFISADVFQRVPHSLITENPVLVRYIPIRQNAASSFYDNQVSLGYKNQPWANGSIVLAASTTGVTVEFLFFTIRQSPILSR